MSTPSQAELAPRPVHVVVRDYPETLAVLRGFGVDVPRRGGAPLSEVLGDDAGPLLEAIEAAIRWRDD